MGESSTGEPPGGGDMIVVEMLIPFGICLVLLAGATAAQRVLRREAHPYHRHLRAVRIAQCVLSWYLVSISFTLWNKFVLKYWRGTGFPFPVFVTFMHMATKLVITRLLNLPLCTRPEKRIKALPCKEAVRGPVPIGVCTAMDVAFSNLSFLFISVTFYTILKASAVLWILAWAALLGLERLSWEVLAICGLVSTGVALASYGEAAFNWSGFFLVTAACALSGLRWALTQTMLEGKADIGGGNGNNSNRHAISASTSSSLGLSSRHRPLRGMDDSGDDHGNGHGMNGNGNGNMPRPPPRIRGEEEEDEVDVELRDPTSRPGAPTLYSPPRSAAAPASDASSPPRPPRSRHSSSHHHSGGEHHHHRPLEILYHISPASALACLPVFLLFEAKDMLASPFLATPSMAWEVLVMLTLGGGFSFLLILAEVKLVKISSSLTMSMFGAVKEVITVALSMLAFHDAVSVLNVAGLVLAIGGAVWYRSYKLRLPSASSASAGSRSGSWAPDEYLPAATGIFNLEDSDEEDEEREREQELRAVGRGREVGLA